ncbi:MAG: hypothetical protein HOM25_20730 [Rhodospirillaceae bacterium]|jgi:OmpA-OmpF porin, OOP family|nr:hypothetical protein [Rhodospirillaceae bacterium]
MPKYYSKIFALLPVFTIFSGCLLVDSKSVKEMAPVGPRINAVLHSEYLALAEEQERKGNIFTSSFFASKARLAARGNAVAPETIEAWNIAPSKQNKLQVGRAQLIVAVADAGRIISPNNAARAQAMYDCWVVESDSERQTSSVESCKSKFVKALGALRSGLKAAQ